ncbi:MAG TPA: NAD(P)H-dependent glycerol-3-phosphate dehydrogenase [Acidimicrobiales bacterium]|nr:NAD(P)H-dependent glycerol-3-phosphate dehydrogenase [Acidimicrobiales bacterium]
MRVSVLGAGSWGTTVAHICAQGAHTMLWARDAAIADAVNDRNENPAYLPGIELFPGLEATADIEEAVAGADLIIVGVPTKGFRDVVERAKPHIRPWVPIVSLSKGLEDITLLRMTEILKQELPGHPAAVLTGPNIAKEILAGQAAAAVIATEDLSVAAEIQKVVSRQLFRVYLNGDVVGCEVCGALKNVIAIATGIGEGLGVGDNTRAMVMCRGLAEITRLGVAMGAEAPTFAGLAGMGDLITTCTSPHSRNRQVGYQLGLGRSLPDILGEMRMVAEGVKTARIILDLARRYDVELPICREIHDVITGDETVGSAYRGLTPAGHESEPG